MALTKVERRIRIKRRIRKVIFGTAERPRLSVDEPRRIAHHLHAVRRGTDLRL